ncbi:MAG: YIP1 family protein [Gammaproteobacteria bacterium]
METSALACLGNIFVEPKKALQDIQSHTVWFWYPLIITIVLTVAFIVWYYATVDIGWLANQMTAVMAGKYNHGQLDMIRRGFTRSRFLIGSAVGVPLFLIIVYLLQALYFFLVSKVGGYEQQSYGKWFSFSVWTSFPNIIGPVASGIAYVFANPQTSYYALDVTSLNTLLFHVPLGHPMMGLAASVHLTTFWTLALMILGFSLWTKKSLGKSSLIVLAPWVVIYAIWIILKLA